MPEWTSLFCWLRSSNLFWMFTAVGSYWYMHNQTECRHRPHKHYTRIKLKNLHTPYRKLHNIIRMRWPLLTVHTWCFRIIETNAAAENGDNHQNIDRSSSTSSSSSFAYAHSGVRLCLVFGRISWMEGASNDNTHTYWPMHSKQQQQHERTHTLSVTYEYTHTRTHTLTQAKLWLCTQYPISNNQNT